MFIYNHSYDTSTIGVGAYTTIYNTYEEAINALVSDFSTQLGSDYQVMLEKLSNGTRNYHDRKEEDGYVDYNTVITSHQEGQILVGISEYDNENRYWLSISPLEVSKIYDLF